MDVSVLVIGTLNPNGLKIAKFLRNQGYQVTCADRSADETKSGTHPVYRLDLRNNNSVNLILRMTHPTVVIYCSNDEDIKNPSVSMTYNCLGYTNLLLQMLASKVNKIILVGNKPDIELDTIYGLEQTILTALTNIFKKEQQLEGLIILDNQNLLVTIKNFIQQTKGGELNGKIKKN